MPLVDAYFFVIPGWSVGPGPEPMNTGHSQIGGGLCAWVPGSRTASEPRNDEYFRFPDSLGGRDLCLWQAPAFPGVTNQHQY
jgi:hypothetical protein